MKIFKTALGSAVVPRGLATSAIAADVARKLGHIAEAAHPYAKGAEYFAERVGEFTSSISDSCTPP